MGDRRIRFCKACHRKFTPKNQKVVEPPRQEAESEAQSGPQDDGGASTDVEAPREPAQALAQMLPPPDQEWTS